MTNVEWISVDERLPLVGQRIVCEFANGGLWAGEYKGRKQSFVRWLALPDSGWAGVRDQIRRQAIAFI